MRRHGATRVFGSEDVRSQIIPKQTTVLTYMSMIARGLFE